MQILRDIRFAIRSLRSAPVVSILAIVCIGLGIGSVTTVYSTATAFTFRPLPQLHEASDLMVVAESPTSDRSQSMTVTAGTFGDLHTLPEFTGVAAMTTWTANISGFDIAERASGGKVSAEFFPVAGRTAALGRTINANDVREDRRVIVLSHALWRQRFGADPAIIGKSVQVNGEGREVVGVMPEDFVFPAGARVWTPLALAPAAAADRTARVLFVLARRAPGVSPERANAACAALGARLAADYPNTHKGWTLRAVPAEDVFGAGPRPFMIVLLAAVAFLLLIACANVANLLLARAAARRREMGQRIALGATRTQLVAQLLTESMLLALVGGVLGVGLAWLGIKGTAATVPHEVQQYIPGFCANVANLLLARATARRREMGQRIALGATRGQLVSQLLTESMLLALAGGVLGVGLAWLGIKGTAATVPLEVQQYIPGFGAIVLDVRAMVVAGSVTMLAGVVFGLVPALTGSSVDVTTALKEGGRSESERSGALRNTLVAGEIALALMLAAGAVLMGTTFRHVSMTDPGFRVESVLTAAVTLPDGDYADDTTLVNFWDRLRESLAAESGVVAAEVASILPMSWNDSRIRLYPQGQPPDRPENAPSAGFRRVSAGYLRALEVPLVRGRALTDADCVNASLVVVLSETAARRLLPGRDAVGQHLVIRDRVVEVVGVVRDVRANPLTSDSPTSVVYAPLSQWPMRTASVVIRGRTSDPAGLTSTLQRTIAQLDSRLAAGEVASMQRVIETVTSPQSATAQMLLVSAVIALVMAAVGTYGVMAYSVARRTREIGVRVALGATAAAIMRHVMGGAARVAAVGVVLGLAGAAALGRSMQAILVDTDPTDPVVLAGVAVLLGAIVLVAGWVPARRASRVDPLTALRAE